MSLRFGQGTDYFNYKRIYLSIPSEYNNLLRNSYFSFGEEPLFYLLNVFSKRTQLGFQFIIFICAFFSYLFLYLSIKEFSINKTISFFILFCNYFFYFFNAIRQALAMSIFLYTFLKYLKTQKIKKYFFWCFFCTLIHSASFISFFVPILIKLKKKIVSNLFLYCICSIACILVGIVLPKILILCISYIIPRYADYGNSIRFNIMPIGLRFIFAILVIKQRKKITSDLGRCLYVVYLYGVLIYFCISSISILSRLTDFIMFVEVILIPMTFNKKNIKNIKNIELYSCVILLLYSFLFIKDLNNAIIEDNYYIDNVFDMPYITIFNKSKIKSVKFIVQSNPESLISTK